MSNIDNNILATSVLTDIRNFSQTFKNYQNAKDGGFLKFMKEFYALQKNLADTLSNDYHMSLIGDAVLTVFMGENNNRNGYAFILGTHRLMDKLCTSFDNAYSDENISFGLGGDYGHVWSLEHEDMTTFLGTVINRTSRIEASTKSMANTTTAIGNSLYKSLIKEFYPNIYEDMKPYNSYDELLNEDPHSVLVSKKFMLQYAMDMPLKGVQDDAPIFRVSKTLVNKDELYWATMSKLLDERKIKKLKKLI